MASKATISFHALSLNAPQNWAMSNPRRGDVIGEILLEFMRASSGNRKPFQLHDAQCIGRGAGAGPEAVVEGERPIADCFLKMGVDERGNLFFQIREF